MRLSVAYERDHVLHIHCDQEGRELLLDRVQKIRPGDHNDLATEAWGGGELTEEQLRRGEVLVHQINIYVDPVTAIPESGNQD